MIQMDRKPTKRQELYMRISLFKNRHWILWLEKSHLASTVSGWWLCLFLSSCQNYPGLVSPPILPAWLLGNQRFIKPIAVKNPYCIQEYYPTAFPIFFTFQNKNPDSNLLPLAIFQTIIHNNFKHRQTSIINFWGMCALFSAVWRCW